MKALMFKLISGVLAVLMVATLVACGNTQSEEPSDDAGQDQPSSSDTQTPTGGSTTADGLTVSMFDPSKTYEMPDLSALNMEEYITLGRYRGLTLTLDYSAISVTDEKLDSTIAALLDEEHPDSKITDRAVEWGDTVVADYVGTLDGVAFSGGTAQSQTLELKDNSGYIPGFVEGLVGAPVGEEYPVDVTFPEDYHNADLAGKAVVFTFTVHYIVGNPELDDAFVTDYTEGVFTSAEEYRESIREQMEADAYESALHSALWGTITENAAVKKYPADAVMYYYASYYNYYSYYAAMYGTDFATFLSLYVGGTAEDLFAFCKDIVKEEMVYHAVFAVGEYTYTEEQYERALDLYTEANYESLKAEMEAAGREDFPIEEAREYFDSTYEQQLILQCLEESAFNDLVDPDKVVINGAPAEDEAQ